MSKKVVKKETGTEVAVRKSNIPANWKEKLKQKASQERERTATTGGNTLKLTKKNTFAYQGSDLGEEIDVIVLDHVILRKWYDRPMDENNPTPPACFAIKADPKNIAPHENSPNKQAEICEDCELNQWGTARDGQSRGKACPERERLALIHVDDIKRLDSLAEAEVLILEIPTTSIGTFRKYVKQATGATELPLWAVITRLSLDPDADYQTFTTPKYVDEVPPGMLEDLEKLSDAARSTLLEPFDCSGYEKPVERKAARVVGKQKRSRLS